MEMGFWSPRVTFFIFFFLQYLQFLQLRKSKEVSGEGFCNWEQLENHTGPHISVLLVLKQVVVGLGFMEVRELPGPSNPFLLAGKKDTGSVRILNRSGSQRSSRHRRNTILLPE